MRRLTLRGCIKLLRKGYRIVIITGGGGTNRIYNRGAQKIVKIKNMDLDWLGIATSKLNGELLRIIFSSRAYKKVSVDPEGLQVYRFLFIVYGVYK
jgi:uridylate kinase